MLRWDIYRAAAKAKWIGTVEAADADAAIGEAAKLYNIGRLLSPEELEMIRRGIEGFDHIDPVSDELLAFHR